MPEGPEIFNITIWLNINCKDKIINIIEFLNYKTELEHQDDLKSYFPLKIVSVYCKGKHIIWKCFSIKTKKNIYFHNHLAMTGRWSKEKSAYSRLVFCFEDNFKNNKNTLYFEDSRKFGRFDICLNKTELDDKLKNVGVDLLKISLKYYVGQNKQTNIKYINYIKIEQKKWLEYFNKLKSKTRSSKRIIYTVLMDQKKYSCLGNYLSADVLYGSKIKPDKKIIDLTNDNIILLFNKSMEILYRSYLAGGLTIKDYSDPDNKPGAYKCLVYGKKTDSFGNKVLKTKFGSRTCHWVSEIQK